jgi:hypothetical protein
MLKKKIWANFQRITVYNFLPKKLSLSSQKYGFGIRDPEKTYSGSGIPDPGIKKVPDPGSGSATLVGGFLARMSWIAYEFFSTNL